MVVLGIGILLYVFYQQNPDALLPKNAAGVVSSNKVFPYFVLTVMPAGLRGLVIAGVLLQERDELTPTLDELPS